MLEPLGFLSGRLLIDLARGLVGDLLALGDGLTKEDLALGLLVGERTHSLDVFAELAERVNAAVVGSCLGLATV